MRVRGGYLSGPLDRGKGAGTSDLRRVRVRVIFLACPVPAPFGPLCDPASVLLDVTVTVIFQRAYFNETNDKARGGSQFSPRISIRETTASSYPYQKGECGN